LPSLPAPVVGRSDGPEVAVFALNNTSWASRWGRGPSQDLGGEAGGGQRTRIGAQVPLTRRSELAVQDRGTPLAAAWCSITLHQQPREPCRLGGSHRRLSPAHRRRLTLRATTLVASHPRAADDRPGRDNDGRDEHRASFRHPRPPSYGASHRPDGRGGASLEGNDVVHPPLAFRERNVTVPRHGLPPAAG
jgi:hypothetical protein